MTPFVADGFSASHHGVYVWEQYNPLARAILTALYVR